MQYEIYRIEEYKKNRRLVYFDEGAPAFCLYSKEIKKYSLCEGYVITDDMYQEIMELLSKRACERCLYLLDGMARTEKQLRDKLKESFYPDEAVDYAISYCIKRHYIDDLDYAIRFISSRSSTLSRRMTEQKLYQKGIPKDIIEQAFAETDTDETGAIRAIVKKQHIDESSLTYEDRQKLIKKLLSRGFAYDSVKEVLQNID